MINFNDYEWTQLTPAMGFNRDGVHGDFIAGKHRIWGGWTTGLNSFKTQYSSLDATNWTLEPDAPWTGRHTCAYTRAGNDIYMVNGDIFNFANDGILPKESWKFDGTTWTLMSSDNGLGGMSLGTLMFLNGAFYFIGGQLTTAPNTKRSEVWKSTNNCASFVKIGDTPFDEGMIVGNTCVFNNKIWKIGGSKYDPTLTYRTYPRRIYSTVDGVTWVEEGKMPYAMRGRHYSQMCVFNNVLWMIGGFNGYYGLNLKEVWATENGVDWKLQVAPFAGKHAMTVWTDNTALYAGWGSIDNDVVSDIWKLTLK